MWEASWNIREALLNKNAPKYVPGMVELGTSVLILKTKTTHKKLKPNPPLKPSLQNLTGSAGEWE